MRNPRLVRWTNLSTSQGLLFFAQRLQEALFDHSLDSYKAPAFNSHTRARELLRAIQDIGAGAISPKNLKPISQELADSIGRDEVASVLLGPLAASASEAEWWQTANPPRLDSQCKVVLRHFSGGAYYERLVSDLRAAILEGKAKDRIARLTIDIIVEWLDRGFSRQYIYFHSKQAFFRDSGPKISGPEYFDTFLAVFEREIIGFDVCFRASRSWTFLADSLQTGNIFLSKEPPKARTADSRELSFLSAAHDGVYLTFRSVSARDAASARDIAAGRLTTLVEVISCHVHRKVPDWEQKAIVWWEGRSVVLDPPKPPIQMFPEVPTKQLLPRLAKTVVAISQPTSASWRRLRAALGLHSSALSAQDPPVQLSTLWASIETLIPNPPEASIIGAITEALVPVLSHRYVEKILKDLAASLSTCAPAVFQVALESVRANGDEPRVTVARLVALASGEEGRTSIYAQLEANPLLRHRLFRIHQQLSRADLILQLIQIHRQRVDWHLRRIYRTRNMLMHAGEVNPITRLLVENLHSYFHEIIDVVESLSASGRPPLDLDAALAEIRFEHDLHLAELTASKKAATDNDNVVRFLFGYS